MCKPTEFQCAKNGKCISRQKVCNQKDDCNDGNGGISSDEKNCRKYHGKLIITLHDSILMYRAIKITTSFIV